MTYCPVCHHILVNSLSNYNSKFCFFDKAHSCRIFYKDNLIVEYFIEIKSIDESVQLYIETYKCFYFIKSKRSNILKCI